MNNDRYATVLVDILEIRKIIVGSGSSYIAIASGLLCLAMSDFGIIESDERRICCYSTVTRVHILEFRVVFHIRLVFNKYVQKFFSGSCIKSTNSLNFEEKVHYNNISMA